MPSSPGGGESGGPTVPCPDCGRSFAEDRLDKHIKICKKVFGQKSKPFNMAQKRLGDLENANELIANAHKIEKAKGTHSVEASKPSGKEIPEWKKKSLAFRAAILSAKGAGGDEEAQAQADALNKELDDGGGNKEDPNMLKCPHCGRTFNKEAGERHVAICIKTFGGKPGGGRLVRGGGRGVAADAAKDGGSAKRLPSNATASVPASAGSAAARKPSAHRSGAVHQGSAGRIASSERGRRN